MANQEPRNAPWRVSASSANCEQLGWKRHAGGNPGEMKRWYPRTTILRARASREGGESGIGLTLNRLAPSAEFLPEDSKRGTVALRPGPEDQIDDGQPPL